MAQRAARGFCAARHQRVEFMNERIAQRVVMREPRESESAVPCVGLGVVNRGRVLMGAGDEVLREILADLLRRRAFGPVGEVIVGLSDGNQAGSGQQGRSEKKTAKRLRTKTQGPGTQRHRIGSIELRRSSSCATVQVVNENHQQSSRPAAIARQQFRNNNPPNSNHCPGSLVRAGGGAVCGFLAWLETPKLIRTYRNPLRSESIRLMV